MKNRITTAPPRRPPPSTATLATCVEGEKLLEVRHYTEAQWAAMRPEDRPDRAAHRPSLGWFAATVAGSMN